MRGVEETGRAGVRPALAFLTILPAGRQDAPPGRAALLAFPVVGLLLGGIWAATAAGVQRWWGPLAAAAAVLAVDVVLTGGLHLDGVADVGDVAGSRRRDEAALEVARDPHVGALGVVAVVLVLLARFALVATLLAAAAPVGPPGLAPHPAWLLVAVPVVGRAAMVVALGWSPRTGGSSASELTEVAGAPVRLAAIAFSVVALLVAGAGPWRTLSTLVAASIVTVSFVGWWRRRVAAASGDAVGACGVLVETFALAVLAWP